MSDLLRRVADGDRAAFTELYDSTSGRTYAILGPLTADQSERDHALVTTYLSIWSHAPRLDCDDPWRSIISTAIRAARDPHGDRN